MVASTDVPALTGPEARRCWEPAYGARSPQAGGDADALGGQTFLRLHPVVRGHLCHGRLRVLAAASRRNLLPWNTSGRWPDRPAARGSRVARSRGRLRALAFQASRNGPTTADCSSVRSLGYALCSPMTSSTVRLPAGHRHNSKVTTSSDDELRKAHKPPSDTPSRTMRRSASPTKARRTGRSCCSPRSPAPRPGAPRH